MRATLLSTLLLVCQAIRVTATPHPEDIFELLSRELIPHLSKTASISLEAPPRWSEFKAPDPAAVINVATEDDVAATVRNTSMSCALVQLLMLLSAR
jgi:hypothetical protein